MSTYILEMRNKLKALQKTLGLASKLSIPEDIRHFIEKDAPDLLARFAQIQLENRELLVENCKLSSELKEEEYDH